jgi:hypothetical protein
MWNTTVQNQSGIAIYANGQTIAPGGGQATFPYVSTGVAVQVPGIGQVQLLEAGTENPGPSTSAVKAVSAKLEIGVAGCGPKHVQIPDEARP